MEPRGRYLEFFVFDEDPFLGQEFVNVLLEEGATSVLDLNYADGTLKSLCDTNLISYMGASASPTIVSESMGDAILLDFLQPFPFVFTFDWIVCTGALPLFPPGNEFTFVNNIDLHAIKGIVLSWMSRKFNSPFIRNPRNGTEIEAFFATKGFTRDLVTESRLKNNSDPLGFYPETLYVFRR